MHLIVYGIVLIAFGAWFEARKRRGGGVHVHRCAKCGAEWAHKSVAEYPSARAAVDAHTCPKCGSEQFEIERHGAADVLAFDAKTSVGAVRTTPPPAAKVPIKTEQAGNQPGPKSAENPPRESVRQEPAPAPAAAPGAEPAK